MTIESLKYIKEELDKIISYEFAQWSSNIIYPYWVGEYNETESLNEDNMRETTFILTGTTRGTWLDLEKDKLKIEELFRNKTAILSNGNGIAVYYLYSLIVPVEDMELKRIQINLQIKEWEVN